MPGHLIALCTPRARQRQQDCDAGGYPPVPGRDPPHGGDSRGNKVREAEKPGRGGGVEGGSEEGRAEKGNVVVVLSEDGGDVDREKAFLIPTLVPEITGPHLHLDL